MKIIKYGIILLTILILNGCNGIKPEVMKNHIEVETVKQKKQPFVIFFQGSGGRNDRAYKWSQWFSKYGIASVFIDSAGARNKRSLKGINDHGLDLSPTLKVIKNNPKLDLNHYAVMGFSKGGTAALESASSLDDKQPKPDFVFALYPGNSKGCPNSHDKTTKVHVFYGGSDDWGDYKGIRNSCKSMTDWYDNATFHLLKGAEHGYDGDEEGGFNCCGRYFVKEPNEEALNKTKEVIFKAIQNKWNIKKR